MRSESLAELVRYADRLAEEESDERLVGTAVALATTLVFGLWPALAMNVSTQDLELVQMPEGEMKKGTKKSSLGRLAAVTILLASLPTWSSRAQERVTVTVRQLFEQAHRIEVPVGSEVIWAAPHFERVWFPSGADSPKVERMGGEFRATFAKPGTYRGVFTVREGHATNEIYNMTVIVKSRSQ